MQPRPLFLEVQETEVLVFQRGTLCFPTPIGSGVTSCQTLKLVFLVISILKRTFFHTFNFDGSLLQAHWELRNVIYLVGKPQYVAVYCKKDRGLGYQTKPPRPFK